MSVVLYCERCAANEILMEMMIIPLNRRTVYAVCPLCGFATKPIGVGGDDSGKAI